MSLLFFLDQPHLITRWFWPLIVFLIVVAVGLALRSWALRLLRRAAPDTAHILSETLRIPFLLWVLAAALAISIQFAPWAEHSFRLAHRLIGAFVIVSVTLFAASVAVRAFAHYGARNRVPFAVAGLSRTLIRVLVFSLGLVALLAHFDINVTPLLTALGVGGLAVALALQDTLANFFAGIHILIEEPISVGHHIQLSSGEEGIVTDIGWRTTRVRTGGNNMIVIPNTKITSSTLTNYSLPESRAVTEVAILAALEADPDQLALVALDAVTGSEGVLAEPPPFVLFDPGLTPTHMQIKVIFSVAEWSGRGVVQSRVRARALRLMRQRGIPLPAPPPLRA